MGVDTIKWDDLDTFDILGRNGKFYNVYYRWIYYNLDSDGNYVNEDGDVCPSWISWQQLSSARLRFTASRNLEQSLLYDVNSDNPDNKDMHANNPPVWFSNDETKLWLTNGTGDGLLTDWGKEINTSKGKIVYTVDDGKTYRCDDFEEFRNQLKADGFELPKIWEISKELKPTIDPSIHGFTPRAFSNKYTASQISDALGPDDDKSANKQEFWDGNYK